MALIHRIGYRSDGSVSIMLLPKDPEELDRVNEVWALRKDIIAHDDVSEAEYNAMFPKDANGNWDRSKREKFRRHSSGRGFIVDPTVKTQREKKLEKLNAANTVPELRELLKEFLGL